MKLYFIRNKQTGLYIQRADGIRGKGGSLLEPGPADNARPFHSLRATRGFMGNWLRGMTIPDGDYDSRTIPVKSRKAADFEIIEKEIDLDASSQITHSASAPVPAQHATHRR